MNARSFSHFMNYWTGIHAFAQAPVKAGSDRRINRAKNELRKRLRRLSPTVTLR